MSEITRIVVLGKTGAGKSSLANTIFGEAAFNINHSPKSGTSKCQERTKLIKGRIIMWIDTPGLFDTDRSEEEMKREIVRCITECAPGPHAFLIVLKVEKFTKQEMDVIKKMSQYFSEEAFKYATLVFTHGDQLPEGEKIEEFVCESEDLSDLVKKCRSQCHVIDNKYWNNNQQDPYRNNQYQVEELLNTIDKTIVKNNGGCYTNELLQAVKREIRQEEEHIRQSSANISPEESTTKSKSNVVNHLLASAGVTTGALLGAFLGGGIKLLKEQPTVAVVLGVAIGAVAGIAAASDAVRGATAPDTDGGSAAQPTEEQF